jgi:hypothetical protein
MRARPAPTVLLPALAVLAACAIAACGGNTRLVNPGPVTIVQESAPTVQGTSGKIGFPAIATKNTTRIPGADPVADAAAVALAVFPSAAPGTHPTAVALAPTDDWAAAIAGASLMAPPIRAPLLLSDAGSLPEATNTALKALAPSGAGSIGGSQLIRIGDVPTVSGYKAANVTGSDPYTLAAAIDRLETAARGKASVSVVVASADQSAAAYTMPAAGWAAESGEPVLFVNSQGVPAATRQALRAHGRPHIYVLGPPSAVPDSVLTTLAHYGTVKRVGAEDPAANSVAFAEYRDPVCTFGQACVHIPHSFGWAIRSPGHAYILINDGQPLDAAAAAPLSGSGGYGPQLLLENPNTLPKPVLDYFLNYATPGYTQEGPTAAVYNHGWMIGDESRITVGVQAQVDSLLEVVPQR